jgi:2-amino-4-hydroxy-6-hydroxymethyldihydropteridine diphosphokinase
VSETRRGGGAPARPEGAPPSPAPLRAYVALGSNLDDPVGHVRRALEDLDRIPQTRCLRCSRLYHSRAVGPPGQPDYVNAVAALETGLHPRGLLATLQGIESAHGRVRGPERWGPRTLDLDLLVYGEWRSPDPLLTIPHPRIAERPFVVFPLQEVEPDLLIPGVGPVRVLAARLTVSGLTPVEG